LNKSNLYSSLHLFPCSSLHLAPSPLYTSFMIKNRWLLPHTTRIIGHRGASAIAPENTLLSFQRAFDDGADGIEFDVRLSKDGVPVIIHDDTIDRVTDAVGAVSSFTAEELANIDAEEGIPTLHSLFELLGTEYLYNIEIKDKEAQGQKVISAVLNVIEQFPDLDRSILLSSFEHSSVEYVQDQRTANMLVATIRVSDSPAIPDFFEGEAYHPNHGLVTAESMKIARENGWLINVWTVNDPDVGRRMLELEVNAILTDDPKMMRDALDL